MATLSEYRIVIGAHACFNERRAAEFIRANARLVTGVLLPLVSDREPPVPCEIAVGRTNRESADDIVFARAENRLWEYEIRLAGERLYLAGLGRPPHTDFRRKKSRFLPTPITMTAPTARCLPLTGL